MYQIKKITLFFLAFISLIGCFKSIPLNKFIDNIGIQLAQTKAITRLTITQLISKNSNERERAIMLIRREQDEQCSSDPLLLFLESPLKFKLNGGLTTEVSIGATGSIPEGSFAVTGTKGHEIDYEVRPISLGNLSNIIFKDDLSTIKMIKDSSLDTNDLTGLPTIKNDLVEEYWEIRESIDETAKTLINKWDKPSSCQGK